LKYHEIEILHVSTLVHTITAKTMADDLVVGAVCSMLFFWSPCSECWY